MSSFIPINSAAPEKNNLEGFDLVWAYRPSWSCDLDYSYNHWFPLSEILHVKMGLIGQKVSEKKIVVYYCKLCMYIAMG